MADGAVYKLQSRFDGVLSDFLYLVAVADALDMGICAELKIDFIRIVYKLLSRLCAYKIGQVSAHFI